MRIILNKTPQNPSFAEPATAHTACCARWLEGAQRLAMQEGVQVWTLVLPTAPETALVWLAQAQAAWAWLSAPERQRCERQHLPALRLQHLATHLLLRYALAQQQASVAPQAWQLSYAAQGAPMLSGPPGVSAPSVSLSRSQGMVVCALADASLALGIDVEWVNPALPDLPELARATLTPREQTLWQLRDAEGSMQAQRWFRVWCAKEAHAKARGHGLLRPVVDYEIWPDGAAALACSPGPSLAQIHDRAYPPPPHAAALAAAFASAAQRPLAGLHHTTARNNARRHSAAPNGAKWRSATQGLNLHKTTFGTRILLNANQSHYYARHEIPYPPPHCV